MTDDNENALSESHGPPPEQRLRFTGRLTAADGLRGWSQARSRRLPWYGAGSVVIDGSTLTLRAWQRTWLGVPTEADLFFPLGNVRNAARAGPLVRFEVKWGRRWRIVEFTADDEAAAAALLAALPATRTDGFESGWNDEQDYRRCMDELSGRTWVTPLLLAINIAAYIALAVLSGSVAPDPNELTRWGANAGLLTTQGDWWRLVTATFLHLNLVHIFFNGWALWNAGRLTERLYGSWTFLAIYLATGILSSLASTVWNPALMSVGASGAIFGVLGALLVYVFRGSGVPRIFVRAHRWSTLLFVGFNLITGALSPAIDNAAHVGGLLGGIALGLLLGRPLHTGPPSGISTARRASAGAFVVLLIAIGVACVRVPAPDPAGPSAWLRQRGWYQTEEGRHLRQESKFAFQLQAGQISPAEYAEGIRRDVLPFYDEASTRLPAPAGPSRDGGPGFAALTRVYVLARRDWLRASLTAIDHSSPSNDARAADLKRRADDAQARLQFAGLREQYNGRPQGLRWAIVREWRALRTARSFECATSPPTWHWIASATDAPVDGPAMRRAAGCDAQRQFLLGDYARLSAQLSATVAQLNDLPDGSATFTGVVDGLDDLFEYGDVAPDETLLRLSDWRRTVPQSVYPDLLEAAFFRTWAWSARGSGVAKSVSATQWEIFRARINLASAALEHVSTRAVDHPFWYLLSMNVALDASSPRDQIRALFDAGATRSPEYHPLHAAMIRALLPRWGGSTAKVAEFIDDFSRSRTAATYARLVWTYARLEGDESEIFDEGLISWPRVQLGFGELLRRHPRSDYLLNAYANLACRKGDAATYRELRNRPGWRVSTTAWTEELDLGTCDRRFDDSGTRDASLQFAPVGSHVDKLGNVVSDTDAESIRRQVARALEAAEPMRQTLSRYVQEQGRLPGDEVLRADPLLEPVTIMGATVTLGPGGSIDMKLTGGPLDGRKFSWVPIEAGGWHWICAQETIPQEYFGPPCR